MGGKLKSLTVACTEEDLTLVDECRKLQPAFPPSRTALALILIRAGADRLKRGETTLQAIYQAYSTEDWAAKGITVDVVSTGSTDSTEPKAVNRRNGATK